MITKKTLGMYDLFTRGGTTTRATHYCAGCGHGIIHKLISEALAELGLQDNAIMVGPVGCGVFGYYYWDCGNISAAHGRAHAVATGVSRVQREAVVLSYQGDGDLGAIGFNNAFQAASRGEHFAAFFVNNATYGMTGGQMAPTTLIGQQTMTSPAGRTVQRDGYPLHVCEVFNQLEAPVYIERVSVADITRVLKAKKAIRKALEIQRDGKGYAFVEFIAPCPTNMGIDAIKAADFCMTAMEQEFPLRCFRDKSAEAQPREKRPEPPSINAFFAAGQTQDIAPAQVDEAFGEVRLKFSGFGGQGILSLGHCVAEAARLEQRFTTWFPTYGPEQRGGAAACSVVISGKPIGSPSVDHPNVLVCMNQPSYERYVGTVAPGGTVIVDATVTRTIAPPAGVHLVIMPAIDVAAELGVPKAANTLMLAALSKHGVTRLTRDSLLNALVDGFRKKPALAEKNRDLFEAGEKQISSL
jgi:2-oxoisovalerate ferredoxin oxidoreductase beta subunit